MGNVIAMAREAMGVLHEILAELRLIRVRLDALELRARIEQGGRINV